MWTKLIKSLVAYLVVKSIRLNASFYSEYLSLLDRREAFVERSKGVSQENRTPLGSLLLTSSFPLTQATQLFFYIIIIFFAPEISFKAVVFIDVICCFIEHLLRNLMFFPAFSNKYTVKLIALLVGFSLGTSNMSHNHIFSFVERQHFHQITSFTRGASTVGNMIGNAISAALMYKVTQVDNYIEEFDKDSSSDYSKIYYRMTLSHLAAQMRLNISTLAFVLVSGIFISLIFWYFKFERKSEGRRKKWSLELFQKSIAELAKAKVWSLAFPWIFIMLVMLYTRLWCPVAWRYHQARLNQPPLNGIVAFFTHFFSLAGSLAPPFFIGWFGQRKCMIMQFFMLAAGVFCCMGQMQTLSSINWYYFMHICLDFILWFSSSFIGTEIAKEIEEKSLIPNVFNLLYICIYSSRIFLNAYLGGLGHSSSISISERFGVVGLFMFIALFSYCVQVLLPSSFSSSSSSSSLNKHL